MKLLYLECSMGAAGDMLMAALLELLPDATPFLTKINGLGIPKVVVQRSTVEKCGIHGTHISVTVDGKEEQSTDVHAHHHVASQHSQEHEIHHYAHSHAPMHDIAHLISHLELSEKVRADALAVYQLIAEAESHAHGKPVEEIHFHEVGTMDAVTDVVGVCLLMEMLQPDRILASPVHVGSGHVHCAHGILPVPAPATVYILQNVPIYGGAVRGELCTPTGAALLKHFVSQFESMPVMQAQRIGYGMGTKDFEMANCVRAFWGELESQSEQISELCCNLDDMTPEAIGFAQERLFAGGALDVFTTPIQMKKNRPAILLTCLCQEEQRDALLKLLFQYTTTLGVREKVCNRYRMHRTQKIVDTKYGAVRVKCAEGYGVSREKPEYEDIAKLARQRDMTIQMVLDEIKGK